MYSVVSNGWVLVDRKGMYTWSTAATAKVKTAWFDKLGDAVIRAGSLAIGGVTPCILELATERPKRQVREIVCCGDSYLASRDRSQYTWKRCENGNIVKADVALFRTKAEADTVLKQLTQEGRGSVTGHEPQVMTVCV